MPKKKVERADNPLLTSEKSSRKKIALSQRLIRNERGGGRWGDDEGMLLREWIQKESTFNEWGRGECLRLLLRGSLQRDVLGS